MVRPYEPRPATENAANAARQILKSNRICLINAGTGGGKTYMSIHTIGGVDKNANIVVFTKAKQVASGEWTDSVANYNYACKTSIQIRATTYNSLVYPDKVNELYNWIKSNKGFTYFILDEVQSIKNPTSISAKQIIKFMQSNLINRMVALSATPVTESYSDAITLLVLAGFYRNKTHFYSDQQVRFDQYHQPIVKNRYGKIDRNLFGNPDKIDRQLASITVSIDTSKLLPPSKCLTYTFRLSDEDQEQYNQIIRDYRNGLYDSIHSAIRDQRNFVATHCSQRNQAMYELITNKNRKKTPVLIYYMYVVELKELKRFIKQKLPDYDIIEVNGKNRKVNASKKPDKDDTIYLIQYRSGCEANNMPFAHLSIFYAPTTSGGQFIQSRGRNIRAYESDKITQIRFVVLNTINAHLWYDIIDNKVTFNSQMKKIFLENQASHIDAQN